MSAVELSRHAVLRVAQRGIRPDDLELAELIGTEVDGGYFVRRKDVQAYERVLKKRADQARRLAGKRVVRPGNTVVTAYHAGRSKQRRLLRRGHERSLSR